MKESEVYRKWIMMCGKTPGIFTVKLHGNKYQTGLPDVLVIKNGKTRFLEFKVVKGMTLPWSKCRLRQHLTMKRMAAAGADVQYAVFSEKTKRLYFLDTASVEEEKGAKLETAKTVQVL